MRINANSNLVFPLSIILLVILVSVSDKVHAKRGCASFGHSCFGGHGKRFDSTVRRDTLQESISQNIQESEVPSPNDELFTFFRTTSFGNDLISL